MDDNLFRGERGPTGDHGQIGERGPRGPRGREGERGVESHLARNKKLVLWCLGIVILAVLVTMSGNFVRDEQAQQVRNDQLCDIANQNAQSINSVILSQIAITKKSRLLTPAEKAERIKINRALLQRVPKC